MQITKPTATCPHCGEKFIKLKNGKIPTHDFPKPCRSVCRGSDQLPKENEDTPLWKDDPEQESRDFFEQARMEIRLIGFAVAKQIAHFSDKPNGTLTCPLCLQELKFSVAQSNGHFAAKCKTDGCINMME